MSSTKANEQKVSKEELDGDRIKIDVTDVLMAPINIPKGRTIRGYVRTSSKYPSENEPSIDIQIQAIESLTETKEWKEVVIYKDIVKSGQNINRIGMQQLLDDLKEGDIVISTSLSRLAINSDVIDNIVEYIGKSKAFLVVSNVSFGEDKSSTRMMYNIYKQIIHLETELINKDTKIEKSDENLTDEELAMEEEKLQEQLRKIQVRKSKNSKQ